MYLLLARRPGLQGPGRQGLQVDLQMALLQVVVLFLLLARLLLGRPVLLHQGRLVHLLLFQWQRLILMVIMAQKKQIRFS